MTGVEVTPKSIELEEGEVAQLSVIVSPSDADNKSVTYSSGDEAVATVDSSGLVTAIERGETVITVTTEDGNFTDTASVVVTGEIEVDGVSITPKTVELEEGETTQLDATISPQDADNQSVTFTSDDSGIATVNDSGLVTAIERGETVITVTTEDGNFTDTASVVVTGEEDDEEEED